MENKSIFNNWVLNLSLKDQSMLMTVIRGTDSENFECKKVTKMLRNIIVKTYTTKTKFSTETVYPDTDITNILALHMYTEPHWYSHIVKAIKIIIKSYPDVYAVAYWNKVISQVEELSPISINAKKLLERKALLTRVRRDIKVGLQLELLPNSDEVSDARLMCTYIENVLQLVNNKIVAEFNIEAPMFEVKDEPQVGNDTVNIGTELLAKHDGVDINECLKDTYNIEVVFNNFEWSDTNQNVIPKGITNGIVVNSNFWVVPKNSNTMDTIIRAIKDNFPNGNYLTFSAKRVFMGDEVLEVNNENEPISIDDLNNVTDNVVATTDSVCDGAYYWPELPIIKERLKYYFVEGDKITVYAYNNKVVFTPDSVGDGVLDFVTVYPHRFNPSFTRYELPLKLFDLDNGLNTDIDFHFKRIRKLLGDNFLDKIEHNGLCVNMDVMNKAVRFQEDNPVDENEPISKDMFIKSRLEHYSISDNVVTAYAEKGTRVGHDAKLIVLTPLPVVDNRRYLKYNIPLELFTDENIYDANAFRELKNNELIITDDAISEKMIECETKRV